MTGNCWKGHEKVCFCDWSRNWKLAMYLTVWGLVGYSKLWPFSIAVLLSSEHCNQTSSTKQTAHFNQGEGNGRTTLNMEKLSADSLMKAVHQLITAQWDATYRSRVWKIIKTDSNKEGKRGRFDPSLCLFTSHIHSVSSTLPKISLYIMSIMLYISFFFLKSEKLSTQIITSPSWLQEKNAGVSMICWQHECAHRFWVQALQNKQRSVCMNWWTLQPLSAGISSSQLAVSLQRKRSCASSSQSGEVMQNREIWEEKNESLSSRVMRCNKMPESKQSQTSLKVTY